MQFYIFTNVGMIIKNIYRTMLVNCHHNIKKEEQNTHIRGKQKSVHAENHVLGIV